MRFNKIKGSFCLQDHRKTFIVESDFSFMSSSGLNAVRIPVGWWISSDPDPPLPFVGGSLQALDNAFDWAEYVVSSSFPLKNKEGISFLNHTASTIFLICVRRKYELGVIVDLHAAPGSQNPYEHSASRDGTQNWGTTDANIAQTVQVIDFLASRFTN
jgi:aryl-phospho-beta-D-glucosidase BglC (GH1 family)